MKKRRRRIFSLLLSACLMLTLLPSMAVAAGGVTEQFTLVPGGTYYFDLSGQGLSGNLNKDLPDTSLKWVPFTYAGTVNAYSLDASANGDISASGSAIPSDRSLFVANYPTHSNVTWEALAAADLIYGKGYNAGGVGYTLRSLSVGSSLNGQDLDDNTRGVPETNEWDQILNKDGNYIPNSKDGSGIYSFGQDTDSEDSPYRVIRGITANRKLNWTLSSEWWGNVYFRPALEVQNVDALGSNGLKTVTYDLTGNGTLGNSTLTSAAIVYTDTLILPAITAANGFNYTGGGAGIPGWYDGSTFYEAGTALANLPTGTTLTAGAAPIVDAAISPTSGGYDLYVPAAVTTSIAWNSATKVTEVTYDSAPLTTPDDYELTGDNLIIQNAYLRTLGLGKGDQAEFKISFDYGNPATFTVLATDSSPPPPPTYSITVQNDGNGTATADVGSAAQGTEITLTASPNSGYQFKEWQTISGTVTIPENKFTMPAEPVMIKAIFEPILVASYNVTLNGGYAGASGAGSYTEGSIVTVYAGNRSGYSFTGWTSSDGVIFTNASSATTTFTLPANHVTVTANWRNADGSSGGGGGGAFSTLPSITIDKKPNQPTIASISLTATVDKNGVASVSLTASQVKALRDAATKEALSKGNTADGAGIAFHIQFGSDGTSFEAKLEEEALAILKDAAVKRFNVNTALVGFSFDTTAIEEMKAQTTGDVAISAHPVSKLPDAAKTLIGSRPAYDLTISYQKNGQTRYVTNFGKGTVTLDIPYKAATGESSGSLYAVYVNQKGEPQLLVRSRYDNGKLMLRRNSLSVYGVGYLAPAPTFNDTTKHWAKDDIDFVISRGLINVTGATAFSPNTLITREDFLTALGKLSGADMSDYTQGSFDDVSDASPAMPYIEWSVQNKIVQGVGLNKFAPDSPITREQIAVMITGYAQAAGDKLPVSRQAFAFTDNAEIGSWAKAAVQAIRQTGVMNGKPNNLFDPAGNTTRAEAATILRRFVELVVDL